MKNCGKCDTEKPLEEFSKNSRSKDGKQSWCKSCMNSVRSDWNAKNSEKRKEANRRWAENNPDKVRAKSLAWRDRNVDRARANSLNWKKNNASKNASHEQSRRALRAGAEVGDFPTLDELIEVYGPHCMYPGCSNEKLTVDHVVPLALGGSHNRKNAQILCSYHNSQKGKRNCTDYRPEGVEVNVNRVPEDSRSIQEVQRGTEQG